VRSYQARATRRAIVAAAAELFLERGYAATTIDAIAERAGVGRKTVFSSVGGGKGALLKMAWDWAVVGDDEPIPMSERPAVHAMLSERDPRRLVRMWVDMQVDVSSRAAPLRAVVLAAADVDAEARALQDTIHRESLTGATAFVTHLADVGGLRPDLSIERAADSCWALLNSQLPHLLGTARAWSPREYGDWLVRVLIATLLEHPAAAGSPTEATLAVRRNAAQQRYEASIDGRLAGHLSYQRTEQLVLLTRTHVEPAFEDTAVADALARHALDDLQPEGSRRVLAVCPYLTWWVSRHPDYAPLMYNPNSEDAAQDL
jgi:AcrR family transcriptional regulator